MTYDHWFQNPLAQIEDERREHHTKLIKMEKEMEEVFERKVSFPPFLSTLRVYSRLEKTPLTLWHSSVAACCPSKVRS